MKFYVHLSETGKKSYNRACIKVFFVFAVPTYIVFSSMDKLLAIFIAMGVFFSGISFYFVASCDYIFLSEKNIKLHYITCRKHLNRVIPGSIIHELYIDNCPVEFAPPLKITNGKYIIAKDRGDNILFACIYSIKLMEMLEKMRGNYLMENSNSSAIPDRME